MTGRYCARWAGEDEECGYVEESPVGVEVLDCGEVPCVGWVVGAGVEKNVVEGGGGEGCDLRKSGMGDSGI